MGHVMYGIGHTSLNILIRGLTLAKGWRIKSEIGMLIEVAIVLGGLLWDIFPSAQHSYGLLTTTELFYFFAGPEHFAFVLGEFRSSPGVFGIVETVDVKKAGKQYISALRDLFCTSENEGLG